MKEIVRIDNSHGYTHIHKNYRRGEPIEKINMGVWDVWEELSSNWVNYVDKYKNKKP